MEAICRLENGKAYVEWKIRLAFQGDDRDEERWGTEGWYARISLTDTRECRVAECECLVGDEEPLESILLQPGLWRGTGDPHLYHMEAILLDGSGHSRDRVCRRLPLRSLDFTDRGIFLNGEPLDIHAVRYRLPDFGEAERTEGLCMQKELADDLKLLLKLGANSICVDSGFDRKGVYGSCLLRICDDLGFLVFRQAENGTGYIWAQDEGSGKAEPFCLPGDIPSFCGEGESLVLSDGRWPTALYYRYLARWGREPFVHILPESVERMDSGNYMAICYSNCSRVALYSDGALFEFQSGNGMFPFREIPAKSPCIRLTAEGEGCSESLSIHKTLVRRGMGRAG